jgi:putative cell wall-binding protein
MAFWMVGSSTAIIASGRNFPDALGASALAGALFCPVLLTEPGSLPGVIKDEVVSLGATEIIIVGGTSAVSDTVMNQLKALPGRTVERIAGDDRYETAQLVAERTVAEAGPSWYDGEVFLATGTDFPDALAVAPLAAWNKKPILLVKPDAIPSATTAAFDTLAVQRVKVLGGEAAVGPEVYQSLEDKFLEDNVDRLHGANRYATAAAIAQYGVDNLGLEWDRVGFATGLNYPDALAGGAVQGLHGSVILLTRPTLLESAPQQKLVDNAFSIYEVRYYGGARAIEQPVRDQIRAVTLANQ